MYTVNDDVYAELKNEINAGNEKLLKKLNNREKEDDNSNFLNSVEFIKISFSTNLLDDLEFLMLLSGNDIFKVRHANSIIRTMLEQTIEFIYLLKRPEKIVAYLGSNIEVPNDSIEIDDDTNLVDAMSQFGQRRYDEGKKNIFLMATDIDEIEGKKDRLALYEIYRILSENDHNAYFQSILDEIDILENGEQLIALEEVQVTYIMLIINAFMSAYRRS